MDNKREELKELYYRHLLLGFDYATYEFLNYKITSNDKIQLWSLNDDFIRLSKMKELIIPDWVDEVRKNFVFDLDKLKGQIEKFNFGPLQKTTNIYATTGLKTLIFNGNTVKESSLISMQDLEELQFTQPVMLEECCCCLLNSLKRCNFENIIGFRGVTFYQCNDNITKLWENRKKEINGLVI